MKRKIQTREQEEKVDYSNLKQYTKKQLLNICIDLNLTVKNHKNKDFIIQLIHIRPSLIGCSNAKKIL